MAACTSRQPMAGRREQYVKLGVTQRANQAQQERAELQVPRPSSINDEMTVQRPLLRQDCSKSEASPVSTVSPKPDPTPPLWKEREEGRNEGGGREGGRWNFISSLYNRNAQQCMCPRSGAHAYTLSSLCHTTKSFGHNHFSFKINLSNITPKIFFVVNIHLAYTHGPICVLGAQ